MKRRAFCLWPAFVWLNFCYMNCKDHWFFQRKGLGRGRQQYRFGINYRKIRVQELMWAKEIIKVRVSMKTFSLLFERDAQPSQVTETWSGSFSLLWRLMCSRLLACSCLFWDGWTVLLDPTTSGVVRQLVTTCSESMKKSPMKRSNGKYMVIYREIYNYIG